MLFVYLQWRVFGEEIRPNAAVEGGSNRSIAKEVSDVESGKKQNPVDDFVSYKEWEQRSSFIVLSSFRAWLVCYNLMYVCWMSPLWFEQYASWVILLKCWLTHWMLNVWMPDDVVVWIQVVWLCWEAYHSTRIHLHLTYNCYLSNQCHIIYYRMWFITF